MTTQQTRNVKASTWIPKEEYEQIERLKGDITVSLWIKRAIRKALSEGEATNQTPKAAIVPNADTTTPHEATNSKEVPTKEVEV